jgi:Ca2+-binding EF-hand superfamily protein
MINFNHASAFNKAALTLIASLSLISLAVPYAMADSKIKEMVTETPVDMDFKKLDINSDKKLSLKEAVKDKALANRFDATDINKDGAITPDEYASYKAASMPANTPDAAAPSAVTPVN